LLPPECPECHRLTTGDLGRVFNCRTRKWMRMFRCNTCLAVFSIDLPEAR
jgi:hypothetical protein